MSIAERYTQLRESVPGNVKIVAVSKTKPASMIEELYMNVGVKTFGENRAQELASKQSVLPGDINWHFIGHLQTNKIKFISPFVTLIQSIDSFRLLQEVNKAAIKCNRIIPCLLQFHIAQEEAKFGFSLDEALRMFDDATFYGMKNIELKGVMGMATFTEDNMQIKSEFRSLVNHFNTIKSQYFPTNYSFEEVSMGMSDDYRIAVEEGSTIIRVGSGIFGER